MAEEKKTPTSGQKPQAEEAKRKAPVQKAVARKEPAKQTPAAKKTGERKAQAAKEQADKPAGKPRQEPKPKAQKPEEKPKPQARRAPARKEQEPVAVMVRASARYVRVAPRKARLVADQVRGLPIDKARSLLRFSPRGAARDIERLIDSAASNAENNHELVADEMRIAEITVDEGPTLRRYRPRALGRATRINKRTSHIAVALTPEE
jgi:ribosomal protein L22